MTFLKGYDAWRLGGDPHRAPVNAKCSNQECTAYNELVEVEGHCEYGLVEMLDDGCRVCGKASLVYEDEPLDPRCVCGEVEDECRCRE